MKNAVTVILILLSTSHYGSCAKILGVFSASGRSHYILDSALMKALAEKGHDVTVISAHGEKEPPKTKGTYRSIVVTEILENRKGKSQAILIYVVPENCRNDEAA